MFLLSCLFYGGQVSDEKVQRNRLAELQSVDEQDEALRLGLNGRQAVGDEEDLGGDDAEDVGEVVQLH